MHQNSNNIFVTASYGISPLSEVFRFHSIKFDGYKHNYYDPKVRISVIPQIIFKRQKTFVTMYFHAVLVYCALSILFNGPFLHRMG